jgi:hypothetical protein
VLDLGFLGELLKAEALVALQISINPKVTKRMKDISIDNLVEITYYS